MKFLSWMGFRAPAEKEGSAMTSSRQVGAESQAVAISLPYTAAAVRPTAEKIQEASRSWSGNCNELSRIHLVSNRGNVKVMSKEKYQVLAERNGWSLERAKGYVDGETFRQRARKPSKYALVGIDEYSLGFRAGYFERRNNGAATMKNTTDVSRIIDTAR